VTDEYLVVPKEGVQVVLMAE